MTPKWKNKSRNKSQRKEFDPIRADEQPLSCKALRGVRSKRGQVQQHGTDADATRLQKLAARRQIDSNLIYHRLIGRLKLTTA